MLAITKKFFVKLIQIHVPLEEHGAISSGFCPFCYDDEESFLAYPDEQKWHCFACQKAGNIYEFIEQTEHLSTVDAQQFIDDFINQSLEKEEIPTKVSNNSESKAVAKPDSDVEQPDTGNIIPDIKDPAINNPVPDIAISEPEIIASEPESIISEVHNINALKHLLNSFHECTGCQGIAIIKVDNKELIGSSIDDFDNKAIQELNSFVLSTLKLTNHVLGDFDNESSKLLFRMNLTMKSVQKKLIWVPMLSKSQYKYNLLMLLDSKISEKMLLIKLKNCLASVDI